MAHIASRIGHFLKPSFYKLAGVLLIVCLPLVSDYIGEQSGDVMANIQMQDWTTEDAIAELEKSRAAVNAMQPVLESLGESSDLLRRLHHTVWVVDLVVRIVGAYIICCVLVERPRLVAQDTAKKDMG